MGLKKIREVSQREVGRIHSVGRRDETFLCFVNTQKRRSNKIYKTDLTKIKI